MEVERWNPGVQGRGVPGGAVQSVGDSSKKSVRKRADRGTASEQ